MKRHGSNVASGSQLWSGLVHSSTAILLQPRKQPAPLPEMAPGGVDLPATPPSQIRGGRWNRPGCEGASLCRWQMRVGVTVPKIKILM